MTATPRRSVMAWCAESAAQPQDTLLAFLKPCSRRFPHGARVITRCCRAIFHTFTPVIQNFRPSSATNRNIPTYGIIKKDRLPTYHERERASGLWDDGIRTVSSLLQLTALSCDVQIRRHAEAVRRCNRDVFPGCR